MKVGILRDFFPVRGVVELFELLNRPEAKRCYAWSNRDPDDAYMTVVLEVPPVKSANDAVRIYIVNQAKKGK